MKTTVIGWIILLLMLCGGMTACSNDNSSAVDLPDDPAAVITDVQAETYALDHVGLTDDDVNGLRSVYTYENSTPLYEVHFYYNGHNYDLDIHAENGQVLSLEIDSGT